MHRCFMSLFNENYKLTCHKRQWCWGFHFPWQEETAVFTICIQTKFHLLHFWQTNYSTLTLFTMSKSYFNNTKVKNKAYSAWYLASPKMCTLRRHVQQASQLGIIWGKGIHSDKRLTNLKGLTAPSGSHHLQLFFNKYQNSITISQWRYCVWGQCVA